MHIHNKPQQLRGKEATTLPQPQECFFETTSCLLQVKGNREEYYNPAFGFMKCGRKPHICVRTRAGENYLPKLFHSITWNPQQLPESVQILCCHQKRGKKAKNQTTHMFKQCQKCKHLQSQPKGKNQLDTYSVQRTYATVKNSMGDFKLPEQNAAL